MTDEQVEKSRRLAADNGFHNAAFHQGYIEDLPFDDGSFDAAISNGVINLSAEKDQVFAEVNRVLRPGGRLALPDIISERQMPDSIKNDADLWAACIGGAAQIDSYTSLVEAAGLEPMEVLEITPLRVHLRASGERLPEIRREEHLTERPETRALRSSRRCNHKQRRYSADTSTVVQRTPSSRSTAYAAVPCTPLPMLPSSWWPSRNRYEDPSYCRYFTS